MRTAMAKLDEAVMLTGENEAMARAMAPSPIPQPKAPPPAKAESWRVDNRPRVAGRRGEPGFEQHRVWDPRMGDGERNAGRAC
jgi:hypothetical protein